jgi:hypothetical protein
MNSVMAWQRAASAKLPTGVSRWIAIFVQHKSRYMAEPKTRPTKASVEKFIDAQEKESVRDDCRALVKIMESIAGAPAVMWGSAIIGFGTYPLVYANGKTADWPQLAFSPRKGNITIYLMGGFKEKGDLLKKLGKHKAKGVCLHIKTLDDIHVPTLKKLVGDSYKSVLTKYGKSVGR